MVDNNVETRIRGYSDEQLSGINAQLHTQLLKTALSFDLGTIFAQMRVISAVSKADGGKGFTTEDATEADFVTALRAKRDLGRVNRLLALVDKLALEGERRSVYNRD